MPPPLNCPRCKRLNPAHAVYCHFDGNLLRMEGANAAAAPGQMSEIFVFPSKRSCKTLDEFVQGCHYEWDDARDLLRRGEFQRHFQSIGRNDLARAAREAENAADADVALHTFLGALPATQVTGPKLELKPRRLVLRDVKPGEFHILPFKILNQGKGILQGRIRVAEGGQWLRVDSEDGVQAPVKAPREEDVILHVDTRGLAAPESYSARLTVVTNGGVAEVPVRLDLGVTTFSGPPPFRGAAKPRELAERMRSNAKAAVPLLENGDIQRWFDANGWTFPIYGSLAPGVAGVQQFFEGLGLSKPPALFLSDSEVGCFLLPPEIVQKQITLFTKSRKWVYAQVASDAVWMEVTTPFVAGPQQVAISFAIDSSMMDEGDTQVGNLIITANGGQRLGVRVVVGVEKSQQPFTKRLFGRFLGG